MKKLFYFTNLLTLCLLLSATSSRAQAPTISSSPVSDTICIGGTATFTASSSDTGITYLWEEYDGIWHYVFDGGVYSGATTGTLSINATASMSGNYYRVSVYNSTDTSRVTAYVPLIIDLAAPSTPTISGGALVCRPTTLTLTPSTAGGAWTVTTGNASVSASGVVSGITRGADTIIYTITNACGSASNTHALAVDTTLAHAAISGPTSVCVASTISLSSSIAGGTWSVTNSNASVSTSGVVTGVATGIDTVVYTNTNICGTDRATYLVTVASPVSPSISGSSSVCVGLTTTLTSSVTGGSWSASNGNVTVSSAGVVTGINRGLDTVTYSVTNACGTYTSAPHVITVDTTLAAATISGLPLICSGSNDTLSATIAGGVWSVTNSRATISTSGIVTAVSAGIDTVLYTRTNGCSSDVAMFVITIDAPLSSASISGPSGVCVGSSVTLSAVAGGTWSISNANATISTSGVVTGVTRGLDTVSYTFTNACGISTATLVMTIDTTISPSTITGDTTIFCAGTTDTIRASVAGGVWSTSNANTTIDTAGIARGISAGSSVISYTRTNGCSSHSALFTVTVEEPLIFSSITGATAVCRGGTIAYTAFVPGGIWSVSDTNYAAISSTGMVTGLMMGHDTVIYTLTNTCGTSRSAHPIHVDSTQLHASISGASNVCVGSFVNFVASVPGGTWSAVNSTATAATTSVTTGMISGISAGVDTIIYSNTNACNTDTTWKIITVETPYTAGSISGPDSACFGYTVSFSSTVSGGTWFSSNTAVAVVDASGNVTGRSAGTTVISYAFTNSCGTRVALDTIYIARTASVIFGSDSVGIGNSITLSDTAIGGRWSVSDTTIATIDSVGTVRGLDTGFVTVYYTVTTFCGTSTMSKVITVGPPSSPGVIYGDDSVCVGTAYAITLSDTLARGGVWSVTNANGTITSTGVFTGIVGGTIDTVLYTITNGFGSVTTSKEIRIANTPPVVTLTGPDTVYWTTGSALVLIPSSPGGTFTSLNTYVAQFTTTTGNFVILHRGIAPLVYTYTNACGTTTDTFTIYLPVENGINNVNNDNESVLNVFPNPNNGSFTLHLHSSFNEMANVVITNVVGEVVKELNVPTNKNNEVNFNMPSGIYLINASTEHGKHTTRIVVSE